MPLPFSEPSLALLGQENELLNLALKHLPNLLSDGSLHKPSASAKLVSVP